MPVVGRRHDYRIDFGQSQQFPIVCESLGLIARGLLRFALFVWIAYRHDLASVFILFPILREGARVRRSSSSAADQSNVYAIVSAKYPRRIHLGGGLGKRPVRDSHAGAKATATFQKIPAIELVCGHNSSFLV